MSSNATELDRELQAFGVPSLSATAVEKVLKTALRRGGSLSELFFEDTASTRVIHEGGRLDKVVDGRDRGVGLRIIFNNKSVYGYTTDLGEGALTALAEALSEAVTDGSASKKAAEPIEWGKARQPV